MGTDTCAQEIKSVTDTCDDYLVGWAYWQFKNYADLTTSAGTSSEGFYDSDGTLQDIKVKALARTYFPVTQGTPTSLNFDSTSGNFVGTYKVDTTILQPTVVFTSSEYYYPNGYDFTVSDASGNVLTDSDMEVTQIKNNYFGVLIKNPSLNGQNVKIQIAPKTASNILSN